MTAADQGQVLRLQSLWAAEGTDFVNGLAWSPDGKQLAVATADGMLAVLDVPEGRLLWKTEAHGLGTSVVAYSPDGSRLASGGQDNTAALWNPGDGALLQRLPAGRGWVDRLAWSPEGLLATAAGRELRLWNSHGEPLVSFTPADSTITDIQWQADGTLMSCCYGGVSRWRQDSTAPMGHYPWKGSLLALAASPDGFWIAGGCQDKAIHLWYADSGDDLMMGGYPSKVQSIGWDSGSRFLASGGGAALIVWDCGGDGPNGREPAFLPAHEGSVNCVGFSHGDTRVASGGEDGLLFIIDMASMEPVAGLLDEAPVSTLGWSPDDRHIAIGYASGRIRVCPLP